KRRAEARAGPALRADATRAALETQTPMVASGLRFQRCPRCVGTAGSAGRRRAPVLSSRASFESCCHAAFVRLRSLVLSWSRQLFGLRSLCVPGWERSDADAGPYCARGPVKLACVIHRFGADIAGGSEGHCRLVAQHLADSHEVTIVTTTAKDHITWRN